MDFPVFDLHCDTSNELIGCGYHPKSGLRSNNSHIDLQRAAAFPAYAQCFACFTTYDQAEDVEALFRLKYETVISEVEKNGDLIRRAFSVADIEKNAKAGLMSAVLTIEGPCGFGFDAARLADLRRMGFLMGSLGWNESNPLTGSNITGEGLTGLGREYVKEMQRVGMAVDVSHISDQGFWDIMEITRRPIIASHSNSRWVYHHRRNLTDEMFLAIAQGGGVAGINLYADFLSEKPGLDTVCDHIFHFLELDPSGRHIALGGDLDGIESTPKGFGGVQDYPKLAQRLLERGLDEKIVRNIFWSNALEALRRATE